MIHNATATSDCKCLIPCFIVKMLMCLTIPIRRFNIIDIEKMWDCALYHIR